MNQNEMTELFSCWTGHYVAAVTTIGILTALFGVIVPIIVQKKQEKIISKMNNELNKKKKEILTLQKQLTDCNRGIAQYYIDKIQETFHDIMKDFSEEKVTIILMFMNYCLAYLTGSQKKQETKYFLRHFTGMIHKIKEKNPEEYKKGFIKYLDRMELDREVLIKFLGDDDNDLRSYLEIYNDTW